MNSSKTVWTRHGDDPAGSRRLRSETSLHCLCELDGEHFGVCAAFARVDLDPHGLLLLMLDLALPTGLEPVFPP